MSIHLPGFPICFLAVGYHKITIKSALTFTLQKLKKCASVDLPFSNRIHTHQSALHLKGNNNGTWKKYHLGNIRTAVPVMSDVRSHMQSAAWIRKPLKTNTWSAATYFFFLQLRNCKKSLSSETMLRRNITWNYINYGRQSVVRYAILL